MNIFKRFPPECSGWIRLLEKHHNSFFSKMDLDRSSREVFKCDLSNFLNIYILQRNVEMFTFYARLCTDQICSRVDCEKSNDRIYSTLVSNKTPGISASLKLWYLIVSQLVLEIFKNFMKNVTLKKVYFLSIRTFSHFFKKCSHFHNF